MRVVHLISGGDVGGAKTHVHDLLKGLSQRIGVTLVCFRDGPFADEARQLGIDTRVISSNGFRGDLRALELLVRKGEYDLVHSHGSRGNLISALLRRRLKLPTITTVHSDYKLDYLGSPGRALTYGLLNRWALGKLDNLECVSGHLVQQLINRGFMPSRIFTLYNGLDFSVKLPPCDRDEVLSELGLEVSEGDVVIGCAARFDPVKDLSTLIRGFNMASKECPGLKLVIAGDGPERKPLETLIEQLGLSGRVCLSGWISRMDEFYQSIDIHTLTSKYEGFSYVLLEGARAGVATVASRVGGVPYLIDHGANGLLFEPGDTGTLAEHFKTLYKDHALRRSYGERLKLKAQTQFSLETTIRTQLDIYERVLQGAARPKGKRDGVLLCGAYGLGNAGDNAILAAILEQLRGIDAHMPVTVLSRTPRLTACQYMVDTIHTFNPFKLAASLRRCKLYVNGGGNLIQDTTSSRSLWFYLLALKLAKLCGADTLMYACGVGPINRSINRKLTKRVLSRCVDAITMREDNTRNELELLGVHIKNATVTADPVLNLSKASEEAIETAAQALGLTGDRRYMGLSVRRWQGFKDAAPAFAALMDIAHKSYGLTTVILPLEPVGDMEAARQVMALTDAPCIAAESEYPPEVLIGLMGRMDVVVGMRLHALIFAAGQNVPLIGVSYDSKAAAFVKYLGGGLCCMLSEATPEALVGLLHTCMTEDNAEERRDAVGRLRALERGNIAVLREML